MINTRVLGMRRIVATILATVLISVGGVATISAQATGAQSGLATLESLQNVFRSLAEQAIPTVVEVDVVDVVKAPEVSSPFQFFFGGQVPQQDYRQQGLGSGVIVQRDGNKVYVLTNNHVVGQAEEISVKLSDQRQFTGKLVGTDERKDLALVVFETRDQVPIATLGDSDSLRVGDWVVAVGSPLGFASSITSGIVSALGREAGPSATFTDYIQTDAAINQGNSGGALVNIRGEVVGINSWIASPSGGNIGLGFAIPINDAKKDIKDFLEKGKVEYGWVGVTVGDLPPALAEDMKLAGVQGGFLFDVHKGSPADRAGLLPGDYVTAIDGKAVKDSSELTRVVGSLAPNTSVRLDLIRSGQRVNVTVRVSARDDEQTIAQGASNVWPGMMVSPITSDLRSRVGTTAGDVLIVNVDRGTPAATAGLRPGDVIKEIGGKAVRSVQDFYKMLNDGKGREVALKIIRQGTEQTVNLPR